MKAFFPSVAIVATIAITALPGIPAGAQLKPSVEANGRQVIQDMAAGNFGKIEAQFDSRMAAALPAGKLGEGWSALVTQIGAFQSIVSAQASQVQTYDIVKMIVQFEKAKLDATVSFDPDGKIAGIVFRPHQEAQPAGDQWVVPSYARQSSFTEKPLELHDQGYTLPGTLTLPNGPGPFPAVVLVHGSGPHDQDETMGPNKPFKDIAWGLASRGIAVYRYTKRTARYGEKSAADPKLLTVNDETIADARAAVALVAQQPGINPEQIFLLGHSLGAYLAPRIATGNAIIAGIVIMGGNTKPMEQLIVEQIRYLTNAGETPSSDGESQVDAAQRAAEQIESRDLKPDDAVPLLGSTTYGAYWLDLRNYNPVKTAEKLKIPILILQGGRDYQVTPANYEDWQAGLGKRSNVTLKLYPEANHLFINGTGPGSPKDYDLPGHVSPDVIETIATWLLPSPNPGSLKGPN
jgi:dienelactone hydrolase